MKSRKTPAPWPILILFFFLSLLVSQGCGKKNVHVDQNSDLQKKIELYNDSLENKQSTAGALLVRKAEYEGFMLKFPDIQEKVTFDEQSIVGITFLMDGAPVKQTALAPEEDFNEAVVTIRYRIVVSPSNRLKTIIVKQKWVRENDEWFVIPDLDVFFK